MHSLTLAALSSTLLIGSTFAKTVLPPNLGPYPVSITDHELKTSQPDPFAPTPENRRLMLTIYQPHSRKSSCRNPKAIDWMPDSTANAAFPDYPIIVNGTFSQLQILDCPQAPSGYSHGSTSWQSSAPLVIFSPGLGGSRLFYSSTLASIASSGFTVVSIDHTYDASAVTFPDGTVVRGTLTDISQTEKNATRLDEIITTWVKQRETDAYAVLSAAKSGSLPGLTKLKHGGKPRVGFFGHSLGGATSAVALLDPTEFAGGINWDGAFWGPVRTTSFDKPFLLAGQELHKNVSAEPPEWFWNETWDHMEGWKAEWAFLGTTHMSFTDLPLALEAVGLRAMNETLYESLMGSIDGARVREVVWKWTTEFFGSVLKGKDRSFLEGEAEGWKEAVYVRGDDGK